MAPFYYSFFSYRYDLFDIEIYQIHLKGLMSMIAFIKIYEKEVNNMDMVAYAKAAVEKKSQELKNVTTSTATNSVISPLEPKYSGYGNVWFVDWTHPESKNFTPIPLH